VTASQRGAPTASYVWSPIYGGIRALQKSPGGIGTKVADSKYWLTAAILKDLE